MEGQGRTLEEIDTMYLLKIKPWTSNKWVAPLPSEIAKIRREAGTHDAVDEEAGEAKRSEDVEKPSTDIGDGIDRGIVDGSGATPQVETGGAARKEGQI
jgi:MFS transporter, SP family, sugar:H+ symporter